MRISDWSSDVCSSDLRQLVLIDNDANIIAHVSGPNLEATTPPPEAISQAPKGYSYEAESQSMWIWRELGESGIIAANLDISEYAKKRSALHVQRSEEHTSELQSLMRISYAVFCLKQNTPTTNYCDVIFKHKRRLKIL